ncbi:MAG: Mth938-like domain-containing protein [Gammaproteobacteria bacterium]|nr:Mth938-like domain-containing protein [Gammaproteobacteria bacterium]
MKLHLHQTGQRNQIRSLTRLNHGFLLKIGEIDYTRSLILTPEKLEMWEVNRVCELNQADFERLANLNAEVVILGTGNTMVFPDPKITRPLMESRTGLEVMDTAAACRTYNILHSDDRRVAAGLIL